MKIASGPLGFSSLFMTHQNQADCTFCPICRKINKKWKPGGPHIPEIMQFDWLSHDYDA